MMRIGILSSEVIKTSYRTLEASAADSQRTLIEGQG